MTHRTPQRARCHRTTAIELVPSFHEELITWWKRIPSDSRSYDPVTKTWRFWGGVETLATVLLLKYFPDADVPNPSRTTSNQGGWIAGNDDFAVLHLLPTAPPELVGAAYRCLAQLHHPDVNGDVAIMRRLAEAHEALRRRLSA
jgi:hypothetical protein